MVHSNDMNLDVGDRKLAAPLPFIYLLTLFYFMKITWLQIFRHFDTVWLLMIAFRATSLLEDLRFYIGCLLHKYRA